MKLQSLRGVCVRPALLMALCALLFCSCADARAGKKELIGALFSAYTADVEFLFECDGESLSGTARVTKGDDIRIDITAPDPYAGISVQSDADDRSSVISLSYSGIRAELSKSVLDRLNLVLTVFSDAVAAELEKTASSAFVPCEEIYTVEGLGETSPYQVEFSRGDIRYLVIYDSVTGIPFDLCAESGGSVAEIKVKKFKAE